MHISCKSFLSLLCCVILGSCSAQPGKDLTKEYLKTVRALQLQPVYPPREEYQVGDVFFVVYDGNDVDNLDLYRRMWLGTLTSVRAIANHYMASRINFEPSADANDDKLAEVSPNQIDFSGGAVSLNEAARQSLPLVSFPTISGRASTAGALGGYGFLQSFGLALGRLETVSLDFGDTRAFGLPFNGELIDGAYEAEFQEKICPRFKIINGFNPAPEGGFQCPEDRTCEVYIVTRTVVTRTLTYSYTNARIARLALSRLSEGDTPNQSTLPIPGDLSVNLTVAPEATPQEANQLLKTITAELASGLTASKVDGTETSGLNFLGFKGSALAFQRPFLKPVAVAYNGLRADPDWWWENVCVPSQIPKH